MSQTSPIAVRAEQILPRGPSRVAGNGPLPSRRTEASSTAIQFLDVVVKAQHQMGRHFLCFLTYLCHMSISQASGLPRMLRDVQTSAALNLLADNSCCAPTASICHKSKEAKAARRSSEDRVWDCLAQIVSKRLRRTFFSAHHGEPPTHYGAQPAQPWGSTTKRDSGYGQGLEVLIHYYHFS